MGLPRWGVFIAQTKLVWKAAQEPSLEQRPELLINSSHYPGMWRKFIIKYADLLFSQV